MKVNEIFYKLSDSLPTYFASYQEIITSNMRLPIDIAQLKDLLLVKCGLYAIDGFTMSKIDALIKILAAECQ